MHLSLFETRISDSYLFILNNDLLSHSTLNHYNVVTPSIGQEYSFIQDDSPHGIPFPMFMIDKDTYNARIFGIVTFPRAYL